MVGSGLGSLLLLRRPEPEAEPRSRSTAAESSAG
jgi:hypothetical protein